MSAASEVGLRVAFHGVRGSLPSPGPATVRFGGNTPCLEIRSESQLVVLDAGSGIRSLGAALRREETPSRIHLFLSHFHWDHIQGLPFFAALYDEAVTLVVHAPRLAGRDASSMLDVLLGTPFFPLGRDVLRPPPVLEPVDDTTWREGELEVAALSVPHPGGAVGYRVSLGGVSLAYLPDCELSRAGEAVDGGATYDEIRKFVSGADLLVHDAMYTPEEAAVRRGWGHSTCAEALELAGAAKVRRLACFHHDPGRTDAELARMEDALREAGGRADWPLEAWMAAEGTVLDLT
jgi:phosphoribosyl 1,2-cyclic phosphodiesterase